LPRAVRRLLLRASSLAAAALPIAAGTLGHAKAPCGNGSISTELLLIDLCSSQFLSCMRPEYRSVVALTLCEVLMLVLSPAPLLGPSVL
jgi:hypothetical protein